MRLLALVVIGALLTACTDSPLATAPEAPLLTAFPFTMPSAYAGPACADPAVVLAGEQKVVLSVTAAGNGSFYVRTQVNSKMDGAGTLGTYRGSHETTDLFYAQHGAATYTFIDHLNIIGRDNPNHFVMHTVIRFRLDEEGTPLDPTVDHAYVKCNGETVGL